MVADVDILQQIRLQQFQEMQDMSDRSKREPVNSSNTKDDNRNEDENENKNMKEPKKVDDAPALVKVLTKRVFEMIFEEVNTTESQMLIKRKIITPVINMIYIELYPYIIAMIVSILTILILSSLTFVGFIFYFMKK